MCGRTACTKSSGEIADCCTYKSKGSDQIKKPQWKNIGGRTYNPSYNKGPKSCSPILLSNSSFPTASSEDTSERILLPMQWGLVPSWHKGDPKSFSFNMINCRHDTLTTKKSFMNALEKGQRCVVLAEGLTPLVDLGLSTDNLPDGLQHLNCGYPGYTTYYSLWQRDEDEKWRNVSSFVG